MKIRGGIRLEKEQARGRREFEQQKKEEWKKEWSANIKVPKERL